MAHHSSPASGTSYSASLPVTALLSSSVAPVHKKEKKKCSGTAWAKKNIDEFDFEAQLSALVGDEAAQNNAEDKAAYYRRARSTAFCREQNERCPEAAHADACARTI